MAGDETTVAPKERVNITYKTDIGGATEEKELPARLLMLGDYTGKEDETALSKRQTVTVNKNNFDDVMRGQSLGLEFSVPNRVAEGENAGEMPVKLKFEAIKDFEPEQVVRQVAPLRELLELREALASLKGPVGNIPEFRKLLQTAVRDPTARARLLEELGLRDDETR